MRATTSRAVAVAATAALTLGVLTACGGDDDDDDPVVTVSPIVSPSATPESPTPAPAPPTDGVVTPAPSPTTPSPTPVTTDKPTDRQTIPPQN
ncbi:hypothetical protein ASG05_07625 [Frigoribacterium sp. Leaf186]|nr:hypothetical protein ASG05_07625 [Frigoribacterium sp. Leaf186]